MARVLVLAAQPLSLESQSRFVEGHNAVAELMIVDRREPGPDFGVPARMHLLNDVGIEQLEGHRKSSGPSVGAVSSTANIPAAASSATARSELRGG